MFFSTVPPEKPVVVDRWGRVINTTTLGPHEEGDDVLLTCRVLGGKSLLINKELINKGIAIFANHANICTVAESNPHFSHLCQLQACRQNNEALMFKRIEYQIMAQVIIIIVNQITDWNRILIVMVICTPNNFRQEDNRGVTDSITTRNLINYTTYTNSSKASGD